ncbi:CDC27 family protein [Sulfurimonas sp. HSL3-7]|uniref:tetratricopeptide repeat protein n=1 Tax=Sulfonitrofixus jiaomeiensis TaxID=3131938 RepID=UPI0031F9FE9D
MLDVLELEKRWFRYRLKKILPLLITAVILLTVGTATSYLYIAYPDMIKNLVENEQSVVQKTRPIVETNITIKSVPPKRLSIDDEQNILRPSLNFMYNIEDQVINYTNTEVIKTASAAKEIKTQQSVKAKSTPKSAVQTEKKTTSVPKQHTKVAKVQKKQPTAKKVVKVAEPVKEVVKVVEPVKEVVLVKENTIVAKKEPETLFVQIDHKQISDNELNSVIKRFEKQNKPALSLFIAKKYYEQGNYKEAYNYALKTNNLNPDIEDSILIFCRSLVKLGRKEEAVTTLQAYLQKTYSVQASILLNEIQLGKFK